MRTAIRLNKIQINSGVECESELSMCTFSKKKKNYYCAFGLCGDIVDFKWCVLFHNFIDKLRTSEKVSPTMYI